jgi:cobalt/nickel transport protein
MLKKNTFILLGVVVALIIAILAPYIASNNPDGLESTFSKITRSQDSQGSGDNEPAAEDINNNANDTGNDFIFSSPFPDYSIGNLSRFGETIAMIIGTILILLLAFGLGTLLKRRKD